MSVCTFIAANCELPEVRPSREYPPHMDIDRGILDDGGADDNYCLLPFDDVHRYTDKKYGLILEWPQYTEGRANRAIGYIKTALQ